MYVVKEINIGDTLTVKGLTGKVIALMNVYRLAGVLRYPVMRLNDGRIKTACFGMCSYGFFIDTPGISPKYEFLRIKMHILPAFFGPKLIITKYE